MSRSLRSPSSFVAALPAALLAGALLACGAAPPEDSARDPQACASCHLSEFQSAKHHVGERPTTCGVCHAQAGWHPSALDHPFWELTGAHEKASCFGCHQGTPPSFKGTKKDCVACHRAQYDEAPNHAGRFPTTCEECHTTAAWKPTLPKPPPPAASSSVVVPPAPKPSPTSKVSAPKAPPRSTSTSSPKLPPPPASASAKPPDTVTGSSKRSYK